MLYANMSVSETKIRVTIGVLCMLVGFAAPIPDQWHIISFTLGVAFILSGALGFCPFKALLRRKLT